MTSPWSTFGTSARPIRTLGGESPGGLMLPPAAAEPGLMYAPRGVWHDGQRVVVADTGNHRILIWHSFPTSDGQPADVVLGQPDQHSEGPAAGGTSKRRGMYLPTGVDVINGNLVVADAWHHRLIAWDGIPTDDFSEPTWLLGQQGWDSVAENAGGEPSLRTFYWPFGFASIDGVFWVADTGNRRLLGWHSASLPEANTPADILIGQDDPADRLDNRGGIAVNTFRWPHAICGDDSAIFVADAGDHRVLGWDVPPKSDGDHASVVIGQADQSSFDEFKNRPQGSQRLRFPYSVATDGTCLFVADTSNNRILLWNQRPLSGSMPGADAVLGQPDMDSNGENRWKAVTPDSLCWPYGLGLSNDVLAIADSGNNRVVFWEVPPE